eukprot:SAG11_NODE_4242_length_1991_cov_3.034884_2_plen_67_part_00
MVASIITGMRTHLRAGYVELSWEAVPGATGYFLQEWSWQQLQGAGWYTNRSVGAPFTFTYNYVSPN